MAGVSTRCCSGARLVVHIPPEVKRMAACAVFAWLKVFTRVIGAFGLPELRSITTSQGGEKSPGM